MTHYVMHMFAVLFASAAIPAVAAAQDATVTAPLNVRSGPSAGYAAIATVSDGTSVRVNGCDSGWCNIFWRGQRGWVSARYLSYGSARTATVLPRGPWYDTRGRWIASHDVDRQGRGGPVGILDNNQ